MKIPGKSPPIPTPSGRGVEDNRPPTTKSNSPASSWKSAVKKKDRDASMRPRLTQENSAPSDAIAVNLPPPPPQIVSNFGIQPILVETNKNAAPETAARSQDESSEDAPSGFPSKHALEEYKLPPLPETPNVNNPRAENKKLKKQERVKTGLRAEIAVPLEHRVSRIVKALAVQNKYSYIRRALNVLYCAAGGEDVINDPDLCGETADIQFLSALPEGRQPYIDALVDQFQSRLGVFEIRLSDAIEQCNTQESITPLYDWLAARLGDQK